ncbi:MAG TPA: isocitrate lyase/phosphoenolpyruvate mutase family protein [Rhizobiaceae bacterium]|nr:isocitrate lyase/phosphoenolpyruvate mutase family protein [Rhizobiaceae bacterium]
MTAARERFRAILDRDACTAAAPIFDPLSARIADMQGWEVCKLSGSFGKFANLAVPDGINLANMSDLVDLCWRINRVSESCLIVDADEGGGNALNVARTVRELEAAGACAIEIEDNLVPQTFGQAARRHALMVSQTEQVGKLEAAVAARRDPNTVIVARTSALSELPREEALRRLKAYSATGAQALMFPELPNGAADLPDIAASTHLPIFVLGLTPAAVRDEALLSSARVRIRFLPHLPYRMAVKAISDAFEHLRAAGTMDELLSLTAPDHLLRAVDRTEEAEAWQKRFVRS